MKVAISIALIILVGWGTEDLWAQSAGRNTAEAPPDQGTQYSFAVASAPVLNPAEELATVQLVEGYRLQLIAADPLIKDPVAIAFDPDGRLWVCEMRGFMPNIAGDGEDAPVGVISVLTDSDSDGQMDASTIFLDGLVLPRGLCWTQDGFLVCENGNIWLCTDVDGDDRCDRKTLICNYNPGNVEHSLNGLMPALDNWIYNAKQGIRLRRNQRGWSADQIFGRGQWGITQDNFGFLRYNVNASLLRGDLVPCYSAIAQTMNSLVDVELAHDQTMFPIRPTPGINRGYVPGFLRSDGSLIDANSNCGPVVFRGDNLPSELLGDVFIAEPAGNLIRRQKMLRLDGARGPTKVLSRNAYEQREFLASRDERFRPVNLCNSPDGTIYCVDMYRGIIQHGAYITPYLRQQILDRRLDQGINLGRIWRIVHESTVPREPARLLQKSNTELVRLLASANGWHRDMAQQLLVQRRDTTVVRELEQMLLDEPQSLGRLHALWTIEGLGRVDAELLYELLKDADEHVRASAITVYSTYATVESLQSQIAADLAECVEDDSALVRMQCLLALASLPTANVEAAIASLLRSFAHDREALRGVLSGMSGREVEFLRARLQQDAWEIEQDWRVAVLSEAATVIWRQRDPVAVLKLCHLLDTIPETRSWQQLALLEGLIDSPVVARNRFPPSPGESDVISKPTAAPTNASAMVLRLASVPVAVERLTQSTNGRIAAAANRMVARMIWPGKNGQPLPEKQSLTPEQRRLVDLGRNVYSSLCAGCHHELGYGLSAKGPPLLGSDWLEDESRLLRVLLNGLQGPISINGDMYNADERLSMPAMSKALDDEHIAGVISYIRREFLENAPTVEVSQVAALRNKLRSREVPWTESELNTFGSDSAR